MQIQFYFFDILLFEIDSVLLWRKKCGEIWTACNHRKKC